MAKAKMTKAEKKIKSLRSLLERRERDMATLKKYFDEDIAAIKRKNAFTKFQIDSIEKGEWPL